MSSSTMSTHFVRQCCYGLVAIGLLVAGYALKQRIHAEQSARAVEITIDYPEVELLAVRQGTSIDSVLQQLRTAGATAVALPEETLTSLQSDGKISVSTASERTGGGFPRFTVSSNDVAVIRQIRAGFTRVLPTTTVMEVRSPLLPANTLSIQGSVVSMSEVGLGLAPEKVTIISKAGLRVMPRLEGDAPVTAAGLHASIAALAAALPVAAAGSPRGIIIFDGKSVQGYRELLPLLADELTRNGLVYGSVEFGKQKGDTELGERLQGQFVRVHSIATDELATMTDVEAIQRFGLAVKDRNIRVLYVHFPQMSHPDFLEAAARYTYALASEIRHTPGMKFVVASSAPAHPFTSLSLPEWVLSVLFIAAGAGLLGWVLVTIPTHLPQKVVILAIVLLALNVLCAIGLAFRLPYAGIMLYGLLAAIGFPLLALTWAYRQLDHALAHVTGSPFWRAVSTILCATGITLIGALLIAAMMSDSIYLVKVKQFVGIKLALSLPLVLFAVILVTDGVAQHQETLATYLTRMRGKLLLFLRQPLYLWGAVLGVLALILVAFILARSGNDAGLDVSTTELKMRSLLEQWFIARPRTKEFAFGIPLFLFSLVAATRRKRTLALVLLLGAAIAETDILNTYCHAHTPFLLSLLRTGNGLWLGILIGVIFLLIFARGSLLPQYRKVMVVKRRRKDHSHKEQPTL